MNTSDDTNNKNLNQSDIALLVNEINECNLHSKESLDLLERKYNVTQEKQELLYKNIQKIVDVTLDKAHIAKDDYSRVNSVWSAVQSEYLKDTIRAFEKNKDRDIHLMTDYNAGCYLSSLLLMYDIEDSDFPKDELIFSLKESGIPTDELTFKLEYPRFSLDE